MESAAHTTRVTKSKRAGTVIPVARIERKFRKGHYAKRISTTSAVYTAAVLEYLCAEILESAGDITSESKRVRITPRHIMLAIENDEELKELLKDVQIPEAGVLSNIHPVLLRAQSENSAHPAALSQEL
ncbi:histone H2A-beta, sperm-like [Bradysia coprophila]|uniref:histone H2A-beta, sperm-like n=1 Tax=Bradysia coprophila TaxID=38358 RepID=UPI00187DB738|nr:histone H2A-beta, sperm-like [Bradysia coprophila]